MIRVTMMSPDPRLPRTAQAAPVSSSPRLGPFLFRLPGLVRPRFIAHKNQSLAPDVMIWGRFNLLASGINRRGRNS
jgi:hypothetical protein